MVLPSRQVSAPDCQLNWEQMQAMLPGAGEVRMWALSTAPAGWAICDGSVCPEGALRTQLLADSSPYGTSGGLPLLPDMRGRVVAGYDSTQTEFDTLGETGGAKTHTLTAAQIPAHNHRVGFRQDAPFTGGNLDLALGGPNTYAIHSAGTTATNTGGGADGKSWNEGGGGSHNNLQPYIALNFIIKT